ncbi:neuraminidase-like domain-containing protein [Yersinia sp. LJYL362]|uniref:Tc toxin subunit A-related protein n=1 Tax=Yersinia sp. LJYL362 TaxID=3402108 RepID=UPI003AB88722
MSNATVLNKINESRRDALVNYAIANNTFGVENINNADDLYQYLLLDTKISNEVKTSNVAEAISSLQLYIERCIDGAEPDAAADKIARHFSTDSFLHDWSLYNKRYSRWAGKEKLKYYAADYIDPTLRYNKTELFTEFEQSINQAKLTENAVTKALKKYLLSYEKLSTIQTVSSCSAKEIDTYFFIGKSSSLPTQYYWRSYVDHSTKAPYWSEWKDINSSINMDDIQKIIPSWENNRLQMFCISVKKTTINNKKLKSLVVDKIYHDDDKSWIKVKEIKTTETTYEEDTDTPKYYTSYEDILLNSQQNNINFLFDGAIIDELPNSHGEKYKGKIAISINNNNINITLKEPFKLGVTTLDVYIKTMDSSHSSELKTLELDKVITLELPKKLIISLNGSSKEYSYHLVNSDTYDNSIPENIKPSAVDCSPLVEKLQTSVSELLSYDIQEKNIKTEAFKKSDSIYLWELFFHIPLLASARFLTEQRFDEAERWLKFLFNSAGYRNTKGELQQESGKTRHWNILPLQQDTDWNSSTLLASNDPDVIAMQDPMQYKLAVFMRTLDVLMTRGDQAYRQLEHDTLVDAKMYYVQASQLLGPRPEIPVAHNWSNPSLKDTAAAISADQTDGNFLPPYNEVLLAYWDKLDIRLYNLRHNLSLDGQPLHLPLFATPVDPKELQRQHGAGDGISSSLTPIAAATSLYRFPMLLERAKGAVSSVMQFGNALQNALEKQDNEALTLLLQKQQQQVLKQTLAFQNINIDILKSSRKATKVMHGSAEERRDHYKKLITEGVSSDEQKVLASRTTAYLLNIGSIVPISVGAAMDLAPNIFGLADGGSRWGAVAQATGHSMQISSYGIEQGANIIDIKANHARRAQEWQLQQTLAEKDVAQLQEQLIGLDLQLSMAEKQRNLAEMEQSHALAIYQMQITRFSGKELYNWMVGRLSGLYFQLFDAAQPLCLMAKSALERDIDASKIQHLFTRSGWNDLYQGLLAGEDLMLNLQKLENIWLIEDERALEVDRTVSLAKVYRELNTGNFDLATAISAAVNTKEDTSGVVSITDGILSAKFNISDLALNHDYPAAMQLGRKRRIKQISVTLPALLGPYQDVQAVLSYTGDHTDVAKGCKAIAISRGMNDSGQFQLDFNDGKYLPFEGIDITDKGGFELRFPNATGTQKELLGRLSDIILHIRYTIRS